MPDNAELYGLSGGASVEPPYQPAQTKRERVRKDKPFTKVDEPRHSDDQEMPVSATESTGPQAEVEDPFKDLNRMDTAPLDGTNIKISEDGRHFIVAYWRRTRCYKNNVWQPTGRWTDPLTHRDLGMNPLYWMDYDRKTEV